MLQITIPAIDMFDEQKQEFVSTKEQTLCLEHSLVSLSKWESKWHKPFLSKEPKTTTKKKVQKEIATKKEEAPKRRERPKKQETIEKEETKAKVEEPKQENAPKKRGRPRKVVTQ